MGHECGHRQQACLASLKGGRAHGSGHILGQPSGGWPAPGSIIMRLPPCSTSAGAPSLIASESPRSIACADALQSHMCLR